LYLNKILDFDILFHYVLGFVIFIFFEHQQLVALNFIYSGIALWCGECCYNRRRISGWCGLAPLGIFSHSSSQKMGLIVWKLLASPGDTHSNHATRCPWCSFRIFPLQVRYSSTFARDIVGLFIY